MNVTKDTTSSTRLRKRVLAAAGATACVVSAGLMTAAPADAASRGFVVTNKSSSTLRLEDVTVVPCKSGAYTIRCQRGYYGFDFEGRPQSGSEIAPNGSQRFELKYAFNIFHAPQYAAHLKYKVEKTNAKFEVFIYTTPSTNDSECVVVPATAGRCTAGGTDITFMN